MGRPLKEIDGEQVYKLARLGCTQEEIADVFNCHADTIRDRFSTELARARAEWKTSIRRAQTIRAVRDRSDTMLIHLGKTYLNQTDRLDLTNAGNAVQAIFESADNPRDSAVYPSTQAEGVCDQ